MQPEIGQKVYVPDPGGNLIRGTVIAYGEPEDAVEAVVDGQDARRDVAFVRHEEGSSKGFVARVPYDLITTAPLE